MSTLGNKEVMARNIRKYMALKDVDRAKMCQDLTIKYTTLCDWINAKSYPRIDKIELMADYFGVTKAALVEESYTDSKLVLYQHKISALPREKQEKIFSYIDAMIDLE